MKKLVIYIFFVFSFLIFNCSVILAQIPNPERELQRQEELERIRREKLEKKAPDIHYQTEESEYFDYPIGESPCFVLNKVTLEGAQHKKFTWALKEIGDISGLCLGSEGLNVLMAKVQNAIINKGFITTRIVASPQNLSAGTFTLTLIPGLVGDLKFSEKTPKAFVSLANNIPTKKGKLLNIRDIEQGLENLKKIASVETNIEIFPGQEEGISDLVITWKQGRPLRFTLSLDDSGSKNTGKYLANATFSIDNMFGFSEMFYFSIGKNLEHNKNYNNNNSSFYYSIPWGYNTFTFYTSNYDYEQNVAGINGNYNYSGTSRNSSLELSRIIHRDAKSKTALSVAAFANRSNNYIDDNELEIQKRKMGGWDLGLNHRRYIENLTLAASLNYKRGTGAFSSLKAPEEYVNEGTARPQIINFDLRLNYPFQIESQYLSFSSHWRGQWALTKLVPRDKFSIGGRYSVRGYDGELTLSADNGFFSRNELALDLDNTGQELYLAYDFGRVWGGADSQLPGNTLTGGTLGYRGGYKGLYYDFFMSTPFNKPAYFPGDKFVTGFNATWQF